MVTKVLALLIGVMPLLINGNYLDCLKKHWPGVRPVNSTHIKVSWFGRHGSGFANCDDSDEEIQIEDYEVILNEKEQDYVKERYSAFIKADPCLKHDVSIKLKRQIPSFQTYPKKAQKVCASLTKQFNWDLYLTT